MIHPVSYWFLLLVPLVLSLFLVPVVKKIAIRLDIVAHENQRTIHHGTVPRIGGVAIFISFIICCILFLTIDRSFKAILIGGFIVFMGGMIDDIYDIRAIWKLLFQAIGALVVIIFGNVELGVLHFPFGIEIPQTIFSEILTFFWLVGVTNAINLLDGLDGLSSGYSIIVLLTICLLSTITLRNDVIMISLILAGAIAGFLFYNFHPASIFVGDCGAQFMGFMIASISLLGFKGGTFITLVIPVILLFIPIMDTVSAIVRRSLTGHSVLEADSNHFHHLLMRTLHIGQTETVLVIYAIAIMFGITAYVYCINRGIGLILIFIMVLLFDLLIEITGMMSKKYHPILDLIHKLNEIRTGKNKEKE